MASQKISELLATSVLATDEIPVNQGGITKKITAGSLINTWFLARKMVDQTINNSVVLVDDSDLRFPVNANTKYNFRAKIFYDTVASADFKWRHSGPLVPTLVRIARNTIVPGGTSFADISVDLAFSAADVVVTGGAGLGGYVTLHGIIQTGISSGTFVFQWAQNTAQLADTTVRAGSYIEWMVL